LKNFFPATALIVPNDIVTKALFNLPADEYQRLISSPDNTVHKWTESVTRATKRAVAKNIVSSFALSVKSKTAAPPKTEKPKDPPSISIWAMIKHSDINDVDGYNAYVAEWIKSHAPALADQTTAESDAFIPSADILFLPLTQFDRLILSACISELAAGNNRITPSILYRDILGKSSGKMQTPTEKQVVAILNSVGKLAYTKIRIDIDKTCEHFGYKGAAGLSQKFQPILPCKLYSDKFRGQDVIVIELTAESPLMTSCTARVKKRGKHKGSAQIIRLDRALLNTGRHNSADLAIIKFYVACRVIESINHKMNHSITFADVFTKCNPNLSRPKIIRIHDTLAALLDNFKAAEIISEYEFVCKDSGKYSILFN